ncbi:hypothetical protein, partial [Ideonella sp.]|uniref:hypothetical protein n=1 Tax=Ideonella sp. TaxID=1929293 RepID=UPI003BB4E091
MKLSTRLRITVAACCCAWVSLPAQAQAETAPGATPAAGSCVSLSDQASKLDMQAATAQSKRGPLDEIANLVDQAMALWQQAAERCEGRAQLRAQRNLADSQKLRQGIAEVQGSGEACDSTQKDAGALQDLARQASTERRWQEAAVLFRKAESLWDLASERCTGNQQQAALKRREQSEIDGHNAEHCGPVFDPAREFAQRFKTTAAGLSPTDRQQQSQVAETLWRDAVAQCKGSAQELARGHAQTLARERGTAWT